MDWIRGAAYFLSGVLIVVAVHFLGTFLQRLFS